MLHVYSHENFMFRDITSRIAGRYSKTAWGEIVAIKNVSHMRSSFYNLSVF